MTRRMTHGYADEADTRRQPSAPPMPAWAQIDTDRDETAPRQPLIRSRTAGPRVRRVGGWVQEAEAGVMDGGGFA